MFVQGCARVNLFVYFCIPWINLFVAMLLAAVVMKLEIGDEREMSAENMGLMV